MCHLVPPDSIMPRLVWRQASVCIWLYHPVPGGANQYVSKMLAEMIGLLRVVPTYRAFV
jgi:hypothetical protein